MVVKWERERESESGGPAKRNGWDFVLFYLGGVVVKCQLWLSEFGDFGWSCDMHMV